jgi:protein-S-isoprenylcysteine O-methyltransferase Ste14
MAIPLPFTWPYLLIFWTAYVWVFIPEYRIIALAPETTEDRGSLGVVLAGFSAAVASAFLLSFFAPWAALPGNRFVWFFVGVPTLIAGGLLRRHCFRVLGAFFTATVAVHAGQRVIEAGAYRWLRHPSYSAALLMVLGIALSLGNWLGVVASSGIAFLAYSHRARIEERALLASLGAPYARFLATRKRFVPFIY